MQRSFSCCFSLCFWLSLSRCDLGVLLLFLFCRVAASGVCLFPFLSCRGLIPCLLRSRLLVVLISVFIFMWCLTRGLYLRSLPPPPAPEAAPTPSLDPVVLDDMASLVFPAGGAQPVPAMRSLTCVGSSGSRRFGLDREPISPRSRSGFSW